MPRQIEPRAWMIEARGDESLAYAVDENTLVSDYRHAVEFNRAEAEAIAQHIEDTRKVGTRLVPVYGS